MIYLILNFIAFMCGFIWTGMDWIGASPDNRMVRVNFRMPITYLFPGFAIGHYLMRILIWK